MLTMSAAYAQDAGLAGGGLGGHNRHKPDAQKSAAQKPKVDEKAYQAALRSVPNKPYDPWSSVR
jgi:hypothetical protein